MAHAKACADDVIRTQSSQSKKVNFLTWPDLAFSFVNKRSGQKITLRPKQQQLHFGTLKRWNPYRPPLSLNSHKLLFSYKIRQMRVGK